MRGLHAGLIRLTNRLIGLSGRLFYVLFRGRRFIRLRVGIVGVGCHVLFWGWIDRAALLPKYGLLLPTGISRRNRFDSRSRHEHNPREHCRIRRRTQQNVIESGTVQQFRNYFPRRTWAQMGHYALFGVRNVNLRARLLAHRS